MKKQKIMITAEEAWEALSGPLPFRMTSDYLFKYLLQTETDVLKAIICAFLDIMREDIRKITVLNAIKLSDDPAGKEMILDICVEMNDDTIIDLEMQVINNHDWPERTISYLCRCFDNLKSGQSYHLVKGVHHLGFLDYTLFPESPGFFSVYRLRNERTGQLYTGKFSISVVELKHINLATEEDLAKKRDLWARFFKAGSWEELKMLAQQDTDIKKAVTAVHKLSQDEEFRMKCWAREDFIRQQIDHDAWYDAEIKKREAVIAENAVALAENAIALAEKDTALAEKDTALAENAIALADKDARIAELEKQIAALQR
jgi:predicted transposase/invertase (TIGR01784 family)